MKKTFLSLALILVCGLSVNAQILSESFSSSSAPTGWTQEDNNSYNFIQDWFWEFDGSVMEHVFYQSSMHDQPDCWVFTPDIAMVSGQTYNISFSLNTNYDGMGMHGPASLQVKIGQGKSSGAQTTMLWSDANILNTTWVTKSFDYNCTASGNYNYSIRCITPKGGALNLGSDTYIDDVVISQLTTTGVVRDNDQEISVFPNPTSDVSKLYLTLNKENSVSYTVYNAIGQTVANGIMRENEEIIKESCVAVIPVGNGNDWCRTYQIPFDYASAIQVLKKENCISQDLVQVRFMEEGKRKSRYIINMAGIGYDAVVCQKVTQQKEKGKSGQTRYLVNLFSSLMSYKSMSASVEIDGKKTEGELFTMNVGVCQYNGGGMRQLPKAIPDDGGKRIWRRTTNSNQRYQ